MLKMNFRGQVPVIKDGEYVCFESLAILYYLDQKYPDPPIFGHNPEEAGTIMRVICEYQSYAEVEINRIVGKIFDGEIDPRSEEAAHAMHLVGGEARTIEQRLSKSEWVVGDRISAADMVIFPGIQLLLRAMSKPAAAELRSRLLPLDVYYPAIARWIQRVEGLPGYERTFPPHWREFTTSPTGQ